MGVTDPDVLAAAATVLSPDGTDPGRDRIVAEVVVAMFKTNGLVPHGEEQDLDVVITQMRRFQAALDEM
jgi:hypothetical protein